MDLVPSATVLPPAVDVFVCVPAVCVMESPVITVLLVPVPLNVADSKSLRALFKEYATVLPFWSTIKLLPAWN